jgi:hypothetical protein
MKESNPKGAGTKKKYKVGTVVKRIHPLIVADCEAEILKSIEEITKPYK